jgi:hypothetical protein
MFVTIQIVINRTIEGYVQFSLKIIYCLSTWAYTGTTHNLLLTIFTRNNKNNTTLPRT